MRLRGLLKANNVFVARPLYRRLTLFSRLEKRVSFLILASLLLFVCRFGCVACFAFISEESCCREQAASKSDDCEAHQSKEDTQARHSCCNEAELRDRAALNENGAEPSCPMACCLAATRNPAPATLPAIVKDWSDGARQAETPAVFCLYDRLSPVYDKPSPASRGSTYLRCCVLLI